MPAVPDRYCDILCTYNASCPQERETRGAAILMRIWKQTSTVVSRETRGARPFQLSPRLSSVTRDTAKRPRVSIPLAPVNYMWTCWYGDHPAKHSAGRSSSSWECFSKVPGGYTEANGAVCVKFEGVRGAMS